jgi:hypothetical protein
MKEKSESWGFKTTWNWVPHRSLHSSEYAHVLRSKIHNHRDVPYDKYLFAHTVFFVQPISVDRASQKANFVNRQTRNETLPSTSFRVRHPCMQNKCMQNKCMQNKQMPFSKLCLYVGTYTSVEGWARWPDRAHFRPMGDCLLWAVTSKITELAQIFGQLYSTVKFMH